MDTATDPSAPAPARTLAAKLAEVMKAVERIPKNGYNEFHKYRYAMEADIVEALRGELSSRGVLLLPAVHAEFRTPVGEKGSAVTALEMSFTFLDVATDERIALPWRGWGSDKEDKGGYKAMTGAEKYFLLKFFLIPTGDDPEGEQAPAKGQRRQQPAPPPQRRQEPPQRPQEPPAEAASSGKPDDALPDGMLKQIAALMKTHGVTKASLQKWAKDTLGVSSSTQIKRKDFLRVCEFIQGKQQAAEPMTASDIPGLQ
jgi:hypothetical protein